MSAGPHVTVLCGGASAESAVSRVSGSCIAEALGGVYSVELRQLQANLLPPDLDCANTVVFPAMHGDFGEDGALQSLLEERGFAYAGSGPAASALCMNKVATKARVADSGFAFARDLVFRHDQPPSLPEVWSAVGKNPVLKPADKGSSVGLVMSPDAACLQRELKALAPGNWMLEERISGREMTVGILDGEAMGVVEIFPEGGVYDYKRKYSGGTTRYEFPARLSDRLTRQIQSAAGEAFRLCHCRDFARVDFILRGNDPVFLEINTIPGLTPTSLLPKSASCSGLDFHQLAIRMIEPAFARAAHGATAVNNAR